MTKQNFVRDVYCPVNGVYTFSYAKHTGSALTSRCCEFVGVKLFVKQKIKLFLIILFILNFRRSCSHPTSKFSTCDISGQRSKGLIKISFGACPFQLGGSTGSTTRNFTWKCLGDWSAHNPGERYLALLDTTNDLQDLSTPHRRYRCAVSLFFYLLHI